MCILVIVIVFSDEEAFVYQTATTVNS